MFGFSGVPNPDPLPQNRCGGTPARNAFEFEILHSDPRRAALGEIMVRRAEAQDAIKGCGHGVSRRYIARDHQDPEHGARRTFEKGATVTVCSYCDKPAADGPQSD